MPPDDLVGPVALQALGTGVPREDVAVDIEGEDGVVVPGTPESAPAAPRLLRVVILTTGISALVFAGLWLLVAYKIIDLNALLGRAP